jgi:DNA-binding CsgD family transcriptional regulator
VEASLRVGSTFERGLTELVAARAYARLGLPGDAAAHLLGAHELFEESGAKAWEHIAEQALTAPGFVPAAAGRAPAAPDTAGRLRRVPTGPAGEPEAPPGGTEEAAGQEEPCRQWNGLLTERELDVARLVVQGRTNRQVAASLYVSVRTVEVHLGRVFRKLGVRSRTELAVLALRG